MVSESWLDKAKKQEEWLRISSNNIDEEFLRSGGVNIYVSVELGIAAVACKCVEEVFRTGEYGLLRERVLEHQMGVDGYAREQLERVRRAAGIEESEKNKMKMV